VPCRLSGLMPSKLGERPQPPVLLKAESRQLRADSQRSWGQCLTTE